MITFKTTNPFEIVGLDIAGPFTTSDSGKKYILICIDYFTNWVEASSMSGIEAEEVADNFFRDIISRHGCPKTIIREKGTQFTSKLFKCLCKNFDINHIEASVQDHQTNGKAERFIRFLENSLALTINKDQKNWDKMLDACLFAYRTTIAKKI